MKANLFTITAVERDVGLSKDVLRVWERRYGFPQPERDARGERQYPEAQVRRLRLIKRLMDHGHRPARLIAASQEELEQALAGERAPNAAVGSGIAASSPLLPLVEQLRERDSEGFLHALQQQLARQGLRAFVQDTLAPLAALIGLGWEQGKLQVFEEHLFTELATQALRQGLAGVPAGGGPRVLLTTAPGESHALGLLMVESVLALEGARCLSLGIQTPLSDIAQAARAYEADVVALSFSSAFAQRQVAPLVRQLRGLLAPEVALWVGGAGAARLGEHDGVRAMASLDDAAEAVARWRTPAIS